MESHPPERILLTSTGPTCEYQGSALGEYFLRASTLNGSVCYEQRQTHEGERNYLYRHHDGPWCVSPNLGGDGINLLNPTSIPTLPLSGWRWKDDLTISIAMVIPKPCTVINISGDETATRNVSEYLGDFVPTQEYSCGRPIYRSNNGNYLRMKHGWGGWIVSDGINSGITISSASSTGSPCPADTRNSYSERTGNHSWINIESGKKVSLGHIEVLCQQHSPAYYDSLVFGSQQSSKVIDLIHSVRALLGDQPLTDIVRRGDVISTVVRLVLYILIQDVRQSLKIEFPEDQYVTFNSIEKVITYLKDMIGSNRANGTKRCRLFITGHQGCGKSSLIHYLRFVREFFSFFFLSSFIHTLKNAKKFFSKI